MNFDWQEKNGLQQRRYSWSRQLKFKLYLQFVQWTVERGKLHGDKVDFTLWNRVWNVIAVSLV